MKELLKIVAVMMLVVIGIGGLCMAGDDFTAPIQESYVGQNYSYTNKTGERLKLSAAVFNGTFYSSTNSTIRLTDGSDNIILANVAVSNCIAWADGATAYMLDVDAVITAFTPCAATTTNRAYILTKN